MDSAALLQHHLDAQLAHETGDWALAQHHYNIILQIQASAEIWNNLGKVLINQGQVAAAVDAFNAALTIDSAYIISWYNLGYSYYVLNDWPAAKGALDNCFTLDAQFAPAAFMYANILRAAGQLTEAVAYYRTAAAYEPNNVNIWNNLGTTLQDLRHSEDAAAALLHAIKIAPDNAMPYMNLGHLLMEINQYEGAKNLLEQALTRAPNYPEAHNNLGSVYAYQGEHDKAIAHYRQALQERPNFIQAHSNLLFCTLHRDGTSLADVSALHNEWFMAHGAAHTEKTVFANTPDPRGRLKIGFVSGDFRAHPVGFFVISTIEGLAQHTADCDIFLYANQYDADAMTVRFQASGAQWRGIWGQTDVAVKAQIIADGIDILIDLTGHNDRHRMGLFARRAAPVQITWAGYMATTGLPTMDWLLGDTHQTPARDQEFYTERLYQLPHSFICYTAPDDAPEPATQTPARDNGYITFGCFNKPAKISARAMRLWGKILQAVPRSRLLMKFGGLNDPATAQFFRNQFAAHGLPPEQLIFEGMSPRRDLLARYNAIDVALDPLPYTGSTTTLEALWMGVPLVTLTGDIFPARHATSYLATVGLPELIATDEDDYLHKVIALAQDLPRLDHYRQHLRWQMQQSPLCDAALFTTDFKNALRSIWQDWCVRQGSGII